MVGRIPGGTYQHEYYESYDHHLEQQYEQENQKNLPPE